MKTFTIKNRYTNEVIVEMEAETLRDVVVANKANLYEANLREADLRGANLCEAKIKVTQKEELLKSLQIIVEE